jgi:hypothetical protein
MSIERAWKEGGACALILLALVACDSTPEAATMNVGVIAGQVLSAAGPEAGVWVIAETEDLGATFRKIVVTNDEGRFLLPELPDATFEVWVRGYGLVDSAPVRGNPGDELTLRATVAATPQEAAQVYPANYWFSMLRLPDASEFPGTGEEGNGISPELESLSQFVDNAKWCTRCHQMGSKATRVIPDLASFESSAHAWADRVQRGQRGAQMSSYMLAFGGDYGPAMFADWSDRIAAGEVPAEVPPRPDGVEQNVVITMWNWGEPDSFMHDEIATDRRDPTVNAYGPVYGVDIGNDLLTVVHPHENTSVNIPVPVMDGEQIPSMFGEEMLRPYRYFGEERVWINPANPHNPMMDAAGRVWLTTQVRAAQNPDWCREGSDNPFAQFYPTSRSARHAGYYDPATATFELIETCFATHHLQFGEDDDNTLWFSGDNQVTGWLNTRRYLETGDARASQGWCPSVLDLNGDGRIPRPWNVGSGAVDPSLDFQLPGGFAYGIIVSPVDGSVWWVPGDRYPGELRRLDRGDNPPETCVTERYVVPVEEGFRTRGVDVDRNGVIWLALAGSSHFASFDRAKCPILTGTETIDGRHCDEGWTFYRMPGVSFEGTDYGTDFHYYNWVDQFNTLGLGENIPIANGSGSDALLALDPETEEWVVLRVPYPQGFYSRGLDGRIDDPDAGWKGRGVYATYGADAAWHVEGGPEEPGNLVKFQIRPDPLAN